jgi:hypothetical protein
LVEICIPSPHPPMKMDRCQSKGVAGGAFCKPLKRNGMGDGK